MRGYVRARLHRKLFLWFGLSILATGLAVLGGGALAAHFENNSFGQEVSRVKALVATQFEGVWDTPPQRDALAKNVAEKLEIGVLLKTNAGETLASFGKSCQRETFEIAVGSESHPKGQVSLCVERRPWGNFRTPTLLIIGCAVLWAASGAVARRLTRPLGELARVAQDLGEGRLSSRARLHCNEEGEVRILADAINEMAARIEKQMADQRELLAAVSHELRTPLGHMRLLLELARGESGRAKALDELDGEIVELDSWVGQLLAHSRLDFGTLEKKQLRPEELARRALERAGQPASLLDASSAPDVCFADATLLSRALSNLIDNALKHGGELKAFRVFGEGGKVSFEAHDAGPGFSPGEEAQAFEAFYKKAKQPQSERDRSLGLGLHLVRRIAQAHEGRAYAENLPQGGAKVGIEISKF
jgi:signal transduction histidine kinase